MANEQLTVIDEKLKTLNSMRAELTSLLKALIDNSPAVCPVSHE